MKRESAKHIAEERQRNVATRRKIFLKAKGWMLIKTILIMVIIAPAVPKNGSRTCRAEHGPGALFAFTELAPLES
jgi:hypothetical protein